MTLRVRPATEAEYPLAGDVCVRAYRAEGQFPNSYEKTLADIAGRAAHGEVLIAVDSDTDEILGCVTFLLPGTRYAEISREDEAEFRMLAVDPDAQGRGVGGMLVQACLARAADLGYTAVAICTRDFNAVALGMYAKFGFRRVPERDWTPQEGVNLVALRLGLPVHAG